jgi:hypothetical protein
MMAHVLFGAVAAGVLAMARSEEPTRERERFRATMLDVIKGVVNMDVAAQQEFIVGSHNRYGGEIGSDETASVRGPSPARRNDRPQRRGAQESP